MLNTKFYLYNTEWLDVVFDGRNKAYGAYDLRNHYAGTINKAMAIAFTVVISAAVGLNFAFKTEQISDPGVIVNITPPVMQTIKPPEEKIKEVKATQPKSTPPVATTKLTSFVVTSKPVTEDPPIIKDIPGEIGPVTTKGPDGPSLAVDENPGPVGPPAAAANGEEIVPFGGLEVNPEPYGGMAAFGKFLGRALRFPEMAQDASVSGRVIMSFVVEKNGELSNIKVERGAGYGFDEEATRVLKLAKAWKPGVQNGQPVRVRYTIPINFQLPAE